MKRKGFPIVAMALMVILGLAVIGVAYTMWSETLTVTGTVQTGEVDVELDLGVITDCVDVYNKDTGSIDACQLRPDKAINDHMCQATASKEGTEGSDGNNTLVITVTGAYPSYHCKVAFDVESTGSVPVHVYMKEVEGTGFYTFTNIACKIDSSPVLTTTTDWVQLHKDGKINCQFDSHFTNDDNVPENSGALKFEYKFIAEQWNEADGFPVGPNPAH